MKLDKQLIKVGLIIISGVLVDQFTKYLALKNEATIVWNTGGVWGVGPGGNSWMLIASMVVVWLGYLILYGHYRLAEKIWMGLILAGGIGNLIDRIRFGAVIDWMSLGNWFAWFNMADVFINMGVIGIIIWQLYARHK